jgi:hypothetical protein
VRRQGYINGKLVGENTVNKKAANDGGFKNAW